MINFSRYPHINDLLQHYASEDGNNEILEILSTGIKSELEAKTFCTFVWKMVDQIHDDSETEKLVLGSRDNTDTLPDLAYEITKYMREVGYYSIWDQSSNAA
jgi:hypothetical protein